ncbi:MAG TPA: PEP-CTERM sorting domain-containing protein [Candidatus Bathyarchaeia archaeon]|nr:PEP-CTERM sorting domain-containing protein [Candidatus Bathyarchaeia archaeon]
MKRTLSCTALVVLALCFALSGAAHATELTFAFPTIGAFYYSATNGSGFVTTNGPMPSMWTAGDFLTQTFWNGPDSADSAAFDFYLRDYLDGATETWDIYINGTQVGYFDVPDAGGTDPLLHGYGVLNFSPIAGNGFYTYSFILQNTVPPGQGSVAFYVTPEPGSVLMLGTGFAGLAGVLRRKFFA